MGVVIDTENIHHLIVGNIIFSKCSTTHLILFFSVGSFKLHVLLFDRCQKCLSNLSINHQGVN